VRMLVLYEVPRWRGGPASWDVGLGLTPRTRCATSCAFSEYVRCRALCVCMCHVHGACDVICYMLRFMGAGESTRRSQPGLGVGKKLMTNCFCMFIDGASSFVILLR